MGEQNSPTGIRMFIRGPYRYTKKHPKSKLRYLLIPSSWLFQGLLYADRTERVFKITIDLILMFVLYILFTSHVNILLSLFLAFIIAHTLNWIFNSNFLNIFTNKFGLHIPGIVVSFNYEYVEKFQKRMKNEGSLQCAAIIGSLSRNEISQTSDLDVRIIRKPGFGNGIRACMFALFERSRATFSRFPMDLYVFDSLEPLSNIRGDEAPVALYDSGKTLEGLYPRITYFGND